MTMSESELKEQLEELRNAIDELIELNKTTPVIVEGKKDVESLRSLGIEGEIINYNSGKSIIATCESVAEKYNEIIILTDWDRKGGTLARELKRCLESLGIRTNTDIRARLAVLCRKDIKDVESLNRHFMSLSEKARNVSEAG